MQILRKERERLRKEREFIQIPLMAFPVNFHLDQVPQHKYAWEIKKERVQKYMQRSRKERERLRKEKEFNPIPFMQFSVIFHLGGTPQCKLTYEMEWELIKDN